MYVIHRIPNHDYLSPLFAGPAAGMTSSSTWKIPLGTSPQKNSSTTNLVVIKELERKLANKKGGRHSQSTTDFKLRDLSKVSPEGDREGEGGARQSKTMSEKQLINENMLQARARWMAQSKDREDPLPSGGDATGGNDERGSFVHSLDTTKRFCIDANDKVGPELDHEPAPPHRPTRAYSNSFPKSHQTVIAKPPNNRPPILEDHGQPQPQQQAQQQSSVGMATPVSPISPPALSAGQKTPQGEKDKRSLVSKTAMKKLFHGFKKGKKNKQAISSTSKIPDTVGATAPMKKIKIKKALSENILVSRQISSHQEAEGGSPALKSYQNVFDDPSFSHYFQEPGESRSNSSSPSELTRLNSKKPKPLPRRSVVGRTGTRNSACSSDQEFETNMSPRSLTFSPLGFTSPTNAGRRSNHAHADSPTSLTTTTPAELKSPEADANTHDLVIRQRRGESEERLPLTLGSKASSGKKKTLSKTTSFNPGASNWIPIVRKNTGRQKLRRAVLSDGDQQDEFADDYIKMNSVCLVDYTPSPPPPIIPTASEKKTSDPGTHRALETLGSHPCHEKSFSALAAYPSSTPTGSYQGLNLPVEPSIPAAGSYQGLNIPMDAKRLSAYYLKIVFGQSKIVSPIPPSPPQGANQAEVIDGKMSGSDSEEDKEEVEFLGGASLPVVREVQSKTNPNDRLRNESTSPQFRGFDDERINIEAVPPSDTPQGPIVNNKRSATPPQLVVSHDQPMSTVVGSGGTQSSLAAGKPRQERKFQYTSVTVGPSPKRRVPSVPKKFKYQTVTLSGKTGKATVEETSVADENSGYRERMRTPEKAEQTSARQSESDQASDVTIPSLPKGEHPLVNLSAAATAMALRQNECSFYVNRKSLIALESCKDLPMTMLSTVDSNTGKVIWHEYVEIDEDKLDKMANSVGVAKSAPIPEKLSMLLALPQPQGQSDRSIATSAPPKDPSSTSFLPSASEVPESNIIPRPQRTSESPVEDNLRVESFASSQSSSDGDYIFNLDDPPSIPPRPANLDALVDQLKVRTSSGDYSYAVIPEKHLFGKHWMMFKSKNVSKPSSSSSPHLGEKSSHDDSPKAERNLDFTVFTKSTPSSGSKTTKKNIKLNPPSLPPKTSSLLREQALVGSAAISGGALSSSLAASKSDSYLTPIIIKTKEKKIKSSVEKGGNPTFVSYIKDKVSTLAPFSSPTSPSSLDANTGGSGTPGETPRLKRHITPPKPIPYEEHQRKKQMGLASNDLLSPKLDVTTGPRGAQAISGSPKRQRQKVHYNHRRLARQKSHRGSSKLANLGGIQKRKKPRGPRPELADKLNQESIAAMITDSDSLLQESPVHSELRKQVSQEREVEGITENQKTADKSLLSNDTISERDLGKILLELGNILKSNQCSEEDLLSAIESQLKISFTTRNKPTSVSAQNDDSFSGSPEAGTTEASMVTTENESGEIKSESPTTAKPVTRVDKDTKKVITPRAVPTKSKGLGISSSKLAQSLKDKKRSYVNMEFADDNTGVDKLLARREKSKTTGYQRPYYNLEYHEEAGEEEESSSEGEYSYVQPEETIGIRGLFRPNFNALASKTTTTTTTTAIDPPNSTRGERLFQPHNTPLICTNDIDEHSAVCSVDPKGNAYPSERQNCALQAPTPTPRERSKSSVISSAQKQQLLGLQQRHDRTLSNPPDPDQLNPKPHRSDSGNGESSLDFLNASANSSSNNSKNRLVQGEGRGLEELLIRGKSSASATTATTTTTQSFKQDQQLKSRKTSEGVPSVAGGAGIVGENTSSYNHALEMEDLRFSNSVEMIGGGASSKTRLPEAREVEKEEEDVGSGKGKKISAWVIKCH